MLTQTQIPLPFRTLPLLRELKNRHPFWRFDGFQSDTLSYVQVEIFTPQFAPQFPSVWVQITYPVKSTENDSLINTLDHQLKTTVQKQMDFTRSLI